MRTVPEAGTGDPTASSDTPRNRWWPLSPRRVLAVAAALVALQLVVRGIVAFAGDFYWDDLILVSRSGQYSVPSARSCSTTTTGISCRPRSWLPGWATAVAPLNWTVPAIMLIVLQAGASLAVLRVLRLLLGTRAVLLLPLTFYLFSPLTLPSFAWWAAGLNSLPMQIGLAWWRATLSGCAGPGGCGSRCPARSSPRCR